MNSTKVSKRILALDILRGVTIAGMIMVNNPGSWGHIYAPLRHAEWNGLTPTDLVFPFFMFIMGISTYISLKKYNFEFSHAAGMKILKRTIVIFLIGMAGPPLRTTSVSERSYGLPSGHSTVSVFWVSCNGWPFATEQPPSLH